MPHPTGSEILSLQQLGSFRYAKPEQLRQIEREQQELTWALDGRSQFDGEQLFGEQLPAHLQGGTAPDQDHVRTLIQKNKTTLEASRPPSDLTPVQRSKYAALERDLRQEIQEGMLSNSMTNDPTEYNVDMELAWQHYKANKAIAWMNVRQILDPTNDSPFFTSIEALRPTEAPKVDLRKLRMNWDNIAFTTEQARLEVQIDDSVYGQFLRLKALDWSDKGIMRELGLSRAGLEVAMSRLLSDRVSEPDPEEDDEEGETLESPEPPETSEADEEDALDEVLAVGVGAAPAAVLPATLLPPTSLTTPHAKASWLREQLDRRHLPVKVLGRVMGLRGSALSVFQVKVSKGTKITDAEWQSIGLILAQVDDDPKSVESYMGKNAWASSVGRTVENAKSRRYAE